MKPQRNQSALFATEAGATGNNKDNGNACLRLALEGERLCRAGSRRDGAACLEAALEAGTDATNVLSSVYGQLGIAHFSLGDYDRAARFHAHDLALTRATDDRLGQAKAAGNLGNALKAMGR
jgi:tetratricopeptide (TPR) repeat protein